jgi:hypothetical protein
MNNAICIKQHRAGSALRQVLPILLFANVLLFSIGNGRAADAIPAHPQGPRAEQPLQPAEPCRGGEPTGAKVAEKAAFLGVESAPVDALERVRLKLAAGTGLRVRFVAPDSPAADHLRPGDILVRLNEQILCNPGQLRTLIRTLAPGDVVRLGIRRDDVPLTIQVRLGEVPAGLRVFPGNAVVEAAPPARESAILPQVRVCANGREISIGDIFRGKAHSIHGGVITIDVTELLRKQVRLAAYLEKLKGGARAGIVADGLLSEIGQHVKNGIRHGVKVGTGDGADSAGATPFAPPSPACPHCPAPDSADAVVPTTSTVVTDADGTVVLTRRGGCCCLCVRDASGKILFSGPVETPLQRAGLPPEIAKKLQIAEQLAPRAQPEAAKPPAAPSEKKPDSAPASVPCRYKV